MRPGPHARPLLRGLCRQAGEGALAPKYTPKQTVEGRLGQERIRDLFRAAQDRLGLKASWKDLAAEVKVEVGEKEPAAIAADVAAAVEQHGAAAIAVGSGKSSRAAGHRLREALSSAKLYVNGKKLTILRPLGEGGYSMVYEVYDMRLATGSM